MKLFQRLLLFTSCYAIAIWTLVPVEGAPCKEDICHRNHGKGEWNTLNVGCASVDAHLAHHDLLGPCSEYCALICDHTPCKNDYDILGDHCDCFPEEYVSDTQCGVGATCDIETDACVCGVTSHVGDTSPVFDENGDCCDPVVTRLEMQLTFHNDFSRMKFGRTVNRTEALGELELAFPELFGLAGTSCTVTVEDLHMTPHDPAGYVGTIPGVYNYYCMEGSTCVLVHNDYATHYSPFRGGLNYTMSAICDSDDSSGEAFFASFADAERLIHWYNPNTDVWKPKRSQSNFFRVRFTERASAQQVGGSCKEVDDDYSHFVPHDKTMRLDWSVTVSDCFGCEGATPQGPVWLPAGVFAILNYIDPGDDIMSDIVWTNDPERKNFCAMTEADPPTAYIPSVVWQAKLYNHVRLADLTHSGAGFQLLADISYVAVQKGLHCPTI